MFCVCCWPDQTAPHIIREPDVNVQREKAYKEGEDVMMACTANRESNARFVITLAFFSYDVVTATAI